MGVFEHDEGRLYWAELGQAGEALAAVVRQAADEQMRLGVQSRQGQRLKDDGGAGQGDDFDAQTMGHTNEVLGEQGEGITNKCHVPLIESVEDGGRLVAPVRVRVGNEPSVKVEAVQNLARQSRVERS